MYFDMFVIMFFVLLVIGKVIFLDDGLWKFVVLVVKLYVLELVVL